MVRNLIFIGILLIFGIRSTNGREVPFTQEDRDRIIRLEVRFEEAQKTLQKQIEALQKQIDELKTLILWGFGILFGSMGILIGFVIWDRRTALAPVARKNKELEEREEFIEKVLKEYAKVEPKLAEIMKSLKLM